MNCISGGTICTAYIHLTALWGITYFTKMTISVATAALRPNTAEEKESSTATSLTKEILDCTSHTYWTLSRRRRRRSGSERKQNVRVEWDHVAPQQTLQGSRWLPWDHRDVDDCLWSSSSCMKGIRHAAFFILTVTQTLRFPPELFSVARLESIKHPSVLLLHRYTPVAPAVTTEMLSLVCSME